MPVITVTLSLFFSSMGEEGEEVGTTVWVERLGSPSLALRRQAARRLAGVVSAPLDACSPYATLRACIACKGGGAEVAEVWAERLVDLVTCGVVSAVEASADLVSTLCGALPAARGPLLAAVMRVALHTAPTPQPATPILSSSLTTLWLSGGLDPDDTAYAIHSLIAACAQGTWDVWVVWCELVPFLVRILVLSDADAVHADVIRRSLWSLLVSLVASASDDDNLWSNSTQHCRLVEAVVSLLTGSLDVYPLRKDRGLFSADVELLVTILMAPAAHIASHHLLRLRRAVVVACAAAWTRNEIPLHLLTILRTLLAVDPPSSNTNACADEVILVASWLPTCGSEKVAEAIVLVLERYVALLSTSHDPTWPLCVAAGLLSVLGGSLEGVYETAVRVYHRLCEHSIPTGGDVVPETDIPTSSADLQWVTLLRHQRNRVLYDGGETGLASWLSVTSKRKGTLSNFSLFFLVSHLLHSSPCIRAGATCSFIHTCYTSPDLASALLPVLLRAIVVESVPRVLLDMIHSVAHLATHRSFVLLVLRVVSLFSCSSDLRPVSVRLLSRTHDIQPRAFAVLHRALTELSPTCAVGSSLEVRLARAACVRDVCKASPHRGCDLAAILVELLSDHHSSVVAMGVQGLASLVEGGEVEAGSAWQAARNHITQPNHPIIAHALRLLVAAGPSELARDDMMEQLVRSLPDSDSRVRMSSYAALEALLRMEVERNEDDGESSEEEEGEEPTQVSDLLAAANLTDALLGERDEHVVDALRSLMVACVEKELQLFNQERTFTSRSSDPISSVLQRVETMGRTISTFHANRPRPALRSSLAGSMLWCHASEGYGARENAPAGKRKSSWHQWRRALDEGLEEVGAPGGTSDWASRLLVLSAWSAFMDGLCAAADREEVLRSVMDDLVSRTNVGTPSVVENACYALGSLAVSLSPFGHAQVATIVEVLITILAQIEGTAIQDGVAFAATVSLGRAASALHTTDSTQRHNVATLLCRVACGGHSDVCDFVRMAAILGLASLKGTDDVFSVANLYSVVFTTRPPLLNTRVDDTIPRLIVAHNSLSRCGAMLGLALGAESLERQGDRLSLETILKSMEAELIAIVHVPSAERVAEGWAVQCATTALATAALATRCLRVDCLSTDAVGMISTLRLAAESLCTKDHSCTIAPFTVAMAGSAWGSMVREVASEGHHELAVSLVEETVSSLCMQIASEDAPTRTSGVLGLSALLGGRPFFLDTDASPLMGMVHGTTPPPFVITHVALNTRVDPCVERLREAMETDSNLSVSRAAAWGLGAVVAAAAAATRGVSKGMAVSGVASKGLSSFPQLNRLANVLLETSDKSTHSSQSVARVLTVLASISKLPTHLPWASALRRCVRGTPGRSSHSDSDGHDLLVTSAISFALRHGRDNSELTGLLASWMEPAAFLSFSRAPRIALIRVLPELLTLFSAARGVRVVSELSALVLGSLDVEATTEWLRALDIVLASHTSAKLDEGILFEIHNAVASTFHCLPTPTASALPPSFDVCASCLRHLPSSLRDALLSRSGDPVGDIRAMLLRARMVVSGHLPFAALLPCRQYCLDTGTPAHHATLVMHHVGCALHQASLSDQQRWMGDLMDLVALDDLCGTPLVCLAVSVAVCSGDDAAILVPESCRVSFLPCLFARLLSEPAWATVATRVDRRLTTFLSRHGNTSLHSWETILLHRSRVASHVDECLHDFLVGWLERQAMSCC